MFITISRAQGDILFSPNSPKSQNIKFTVMLDQEIWRTSSGLMWMWSKVLCISDSLPGGRDLPRGQKINLSDGKIINKMNGRSFVVKYWIVLIIHDSKICSNPRKEHHSQFIHISNLCKGDTSRFFLALKGPKPKKVNILTSVVCVYFLSVYRSNPFRLLLSRVVTQFFVFLYCKCLWRGLKFVARKFTGRCELQRICYNNKHGARRTLKIGRPTHCLHAAWHLILNVI